MRNTKSGLIGIVRAGLLFSFLVASLAGCAEEGAGTIKIEGDKSKAADPFAGKTAPSKKDPAVKSVKEKVGG